MRVTREQAEEIQRAAGSGEAYEFARDLATSYLAALDVCEALVEQEVARGARNYHSLIKRGSIEYQAAAERCFQADAALDAALEKWREW